MNEIRGREMKEQRIDPRGRISTPPGLILSIYDADEAQAGTVRDRKGPSSLHVWKRDPRTQEDEDREVFLEEDITPGIFNNPIRTPIC